MQHSSYILEAQNLSIGYDYRKKTLVREAIDLQLLAGELVCLMGPNGAGKSTLLRTLAGVQDPLGGNLFLQGRSLVSLSAREKAQHISLVLTDPVLSHNLRVLEVVQLGRHPYTGWWGRLTEEDRAVVEKALADTQTLHLAERKVYTLSDGQRQKVMIARALAQSGSLLLLDEPTAHLDLTHRIQIMHLLRQIAQQQQRAIIVATHELDLALQTADKLWLMPQKASQPMQDGLPEDLVLNGTIAATFAKEPYGFDLQTARFYQPFQTTAAVQLEGEEPALYWTRQALQRQGWAVDDTAAQKVLVQKLSNGWEWQLIREGKSQSFSSLKQLNEALVVSLV